MQLGNYELDDIYCGDSAVMLAGLPDSCIDLTVTSPPYDNLRAYNGYSWDFTTIATQLYRVTKPGGVVVWVVGDATINGSETGSSFRQALGFMEIGFNLHDTMIYQTDKPPMNDNRYQACFEYMFVFSKGKVKTFNPIKEPMSLETIKRRKSGKNAGGYQRESDGNFDKPYSRPRDIYNVVRTNIWHIKSGFSKQDPMASDHPAIFPEALARDHVISWSNAGDVILDPFMGSGTVAKMAKTLSRHFIGFEISEEYVTLAKKRVEYAPTPLPLFVENGQPKAEQTSLF